jgi:hypothetical protein
MSAIAVVEKAVDQQLEERDLTCRGRYRAGLGQARVTCVGTKNPATAK